MPKRKDKFGHYPYYTVGVYPVGKILPQLDAGTGSVLQVVGEDGKAYRVKRKNTRYRLFRQSARCACCGIEGKLMVLQRQEADEPGTAVFNLFALDGQGAPILLTRDHIVPRAAGGGDSLGNLQILCVRCNALKGCQVIGNEALRVMREERREANRQRRQLRKLRTADKEEAQDGPVLMQMA